MNLKPLATNKTELTLEQDGQRIRVLFSYQTPVAYEVLTPEGMMRYVTNQYYSPTTTKHIKSWIPLEDAIEVDQSEIDNIVNGGK